jgi:hypothetical protein
MLHCCRVQFDRQELGVELVRDTDVMPVDPYENLPPALLAARPHMLLNGRQIVNGQPVRPLAPRHPPLALPSPAMAATAAAVAAASAVGTPLATGPPASTSALLASAQADAAALGAGEAEQPSQQQQPQQQQQQQQDHDLDVHVLSKVRMALGAVLLLSGRCLAQAVHRACCFLLILAGAGPCQPGLPAAPFRPQRAQCLFLSNISHSHASCVASSSPLPLRCPLSAGCGTG